MSRDRLKYIIIFCLLVWASCAFSAENAVYDPQGRRNPFIPLITPDGRLLKLDRLEGEDGLLLEGIIYDENGLSYAIVNGQVAKVNDKVGDYHILKIEEERVVFARDGQITELRLKEEGD
ncbi:MAG: hypothetical protein WC301_04100 [Candidatus Omnitrophota bacterium]|jgi:hypothetical protein